MLQTTGDDAGACDDAAIFTVMHSVAHRDLRAKAWHRTVAGDVAEPLASAAISFQTFAVGTVVRKNDRNETRFLPALMTNYRIGSRTETRFGILCCVADSDAINIEGTINGLTPLGKTFDSNIQPKYWNYSNVEQLGVKKNFAHQAQGRTGNCLLIQDQFVGVGSIGATSPGYVALGQPWAYISSLTAINDATAGTYGGITWTHRPDSVAVWVKRVYDGSVDQAAGDHTADENFNIVYYAWTGTSFGGQYMAKN